MEQLYGGPVSPGESRPTTAPTAVPAALDADEDAAIAAALAESAGAAPPEVPLWGEGVRGEALRPSGTAAWSASASRARAVEEREREHA